MKINWQMLIFVILATLKLASIGVVATWSWWVVTMVLWGPIALAVLIAILVLIIKECQK